MDQEASFWADQGVSPIGPDTAFGLVLAPFVVERLKDEQGSEDESLQRVFAFLEELTYSNDDGVLSAIDISFGEELLSHPREYERARRYMGPRLRETFDLVQSRRKLLPG